MLRLLREHFRCITTSSCASFDDSDILLRTKAVARDARTRDPDSFYLQSPPRLLLAAAASCRRHEAPLSSASSPSPLLGCRVRCTLPSHPPADADRAGSVLQCAGWRCDHHFLPGLLRRHQHPQAELCGQEPDEDPQ